jgi:murein L,D-transpeptidase YcbB/YkuD
MPRAAAVPSGNPEPFEMPLTRRRHATDRRRPDIRVRSIRLALLAGLALAACNRGDQRGDSPARDSAGGEVTRGRGSWNPATLTAVRGVPVAAVRAALATRLAGAPPAPLKDDQWRHARALYKSLGGVPLWLADDGPDGDRVTALLRALVDADHDALRLDAYPLPALATAMAAARDGHPTAEQLAEADVLLTSAFAALGEDLLTGQVNPRDVSQDWHIDPKEEEVDSALVRSLTQPAIDSGLARMRPEDPDYEALRKELSHYRELAKRGWPEVPAGRVLKPGEADDAARLQALRARLAAEELLDASGTADTTGVPAANAIGGDSAARAVRARPTQARAPRPGEARYDAALAGAVAVYQARHAIVVDSILGEETVKSMNYAATYRLAQIAANLERHRWMPRALGERYIAVNVPAFHLDAFENGRPALEMKVVVGQEYEDKKTAVFSDTMTTVVFRPYWLITPDIQAKETEPKIAEDPSYMEENDLEYYMDGGQRRIRQRPGPKNSLGFVKFLFPNSFNIYLHDTPQRELFEKDVRAFSHGCIRIEKPAELAQWVLGWDAGKVEQAMHDGADNRWVKLPHPVPVYITYFTAYMRDGVLHFGNDLYDRDASLVQAMTAGAGQSGETVRAVDTLRKLVAD